MLILKSILIQFKNSILSFDTNHYWRLNMLSDFRTYQLAVKFYKACKSLEVTGNLRDQLVRASSSIALNLAEGSGRRTRRDKVRFYHISLGSLRECQSILELTDESMCVELADILGAHLYRLIQSVGGV